MLDPRDPETKQLREIRYQNACELFKKGEMREAVFRATLYSLGFRSYEIVQEVRLHEPPNIKRY